VGLNHEKANVREGAQATARAEYEMGDKLTPGQFFHERSQSKLRYLVRNFDHPVYRNMRLQAAGFKPFSHAQRKLIWRIAYENGFELPD